MNTPIITVEKDARGWITTTKYPDNSTGMSAEHHSTVAERVMFSDLTSLRARLDENMTAVADYAIWLEKAERERDEAKHQTHLQCQQALVYKDSAEAANRTLSSMRVSEDAWLLERDQLHANLSEYMAKCGDLSGDVAILISENAALRSALSDIASLQETWPLWEFRDLYETSQQQARAALAKEWKT